MIGGSERAQEDKALRERIGAQLHEKRLKDEKTIQEMAQKLNMETANLKNYEARGTLCLSRLIRFCAAYGLRPYDVINGALPRGQKI